MNRYTGETIDFVLEGNSTYNFGTTGTQPFKVFIYPDGTNTKLSANEQLIKIIDSRDSEDSITHGDGFVQKDTNYVAHCVLPYTVTKGMKTGMYTVEVLYGDDRRSVLLVNSAFSLVLGYSNNIN